MLIGFNIVILFVVGWFIVGFDMDYEVVNLVMLGYWVWVGVNVCIVVGVLIGDNCVIGVGSLVIELLFVNILVYGILVVCIWKI